jgi:hypothetical protein
MRILFALFILSSCSQMSPSRWNPHRNVATQRVHAETLLALSKEDRLPASPAPELGARLGDLNKVKPGKFEVYVFPKMNSQNRKSKEADEVYLGRPQVFEVSLIAENPCKQFITQRLFAQLKAGQAFPVALASTSKRCAVIEFTDKKLKTRGKGDLKLNDVLVTRLFLDEDYKVYSVDRDIYESTGKTKTVRMLNVDSLDSTSGLSLFPIDLPIQKISFELKNPKASFEKNLDGIAVYQIQKHHNRKFQVPDCSGGVMKFKDELGSPVTLGWCQNMPWPSFSENSRFLSVTQPLTLGVSR